MFIGTRLATMPSALRQRHFLLWLLLMAVVGSIALTATRAQAYTCRYASTAPNGLAGRYIAGGSNTTIQVPVQDTAETGKVNVIDLSAYIECKNDLPQTYSDYMDLKQADTVLSSNFDVQVQARSSIYNMPFNGTASILRLMKGGSGAYAPIPLKIFYNMKEIPGERVAIHKGQTIGRIVAHKYSDPPGGAPTFTWNLTAANDTIVTSGGCGINNGEQIEIDFGAFTQQQLSSTTPSRTVSRYVPYQCRSGNVTMGIRLSLVADRASFSDQLIKTTNTNIGIKAMRRDDQLLPNENSIRSSLNQGTGGDTFNFSLLKASGSTPDTGNFTGSATLIMSAD